MMRLFTRVMLAAIVVAAAGFDAAQAQTKPKVTTLGPDFPKAALFVGNSFFYYNNGMPGHLTLMERAADAANKAAYRNTMVTIGGSGLDWHDMDNLLRPGGLGAYSFDEQNVVKFNKPGRQYDAVVMMDCSQCPDPSAIERRVHELCEERQRYRSRPRHASGAVHVLGLCRQAGNDGRARRGLHARRQHQ